MIHAYTGTHHSITEASEGDLEPQIGIMLIFVACNHFLNIAAEVIRGNISLIIRSQISLTTFVNKALSRQIISRAERDEITDTSTGVSTDARMNRLLELVAVAIEFKGAVFRDILNILREEDNVRADMLVKMLLEAYDKRVNSSQN